MAVLILDVRDLLEHGCTTAAMEGEGIVACNENFVVRQHPYWSLPLSNIRGREGNMVEYLHCIRCYGYPT